MKRFVSCVLFLLMGIGMIPLAEARTDRLMTYREGQIWTGILRFLRVDMGYRVIERDREAGYLLFEYKDGGRAHSASIEMVPVVESDRRYVRTTLQIPSMPSYVGRVLFDKLERKLKTEYGDPPPAARADSARAGHGGGQGAATKPTAAGEEDDAADGGDFEDTTEEDQ